MTAAAHIKVASKTLKDVEDKLTWKINKKAYLFGSIAPDVNCAFPLHTINNTLNRFEKRLERIDKSNSNIIKSFTLGVVTHYICDYFCYAHTMDLYGLKHWIYEKVMRKHLKNHAENIQNLTDSLEFKWESIQSHVNVEEIQRYTKVCTEVHVNYIIDILTGMHNEYLNTIDSNIDKEWFKSLKQMDEDIQYATFMCRRIASLILDLGLENMRLNFGEKILV